MKVGTLEGNNGNSLACLNLLSGLRTPVIVVFSPQKRLCLRYVQLLWCYCYQDTIPKRFLWASVSFLRSALLVTPSALLHDITWFYTILRLFLPWPNLYAATCVQDQLGWTGTSEGTYFPWVRLGFHIIPAFKPMRNIWELIREERGVLCFEITTCQKLCICLEIL